MASFPQLKLREPVQTLELGSPRMRLGFDIMEASKTSRLWCTFLGPDLVVHGRHQLAVRLQSAQGFDIGMSLVSAVKQRSSRCVQLKVHMAPLVYVTHTLVHRVFCL